MSPPLQLTQAASAALDASLADAHRRFSEANPRSLQMFEENAQYMPGANSRSTLFYAPFPLTIAGGEGATVWDADGHRYTDFIGEYSAGIYGHSAPEIRQAIEQAMASGINLCGHNLLEGQFARAICERIPSIELVRFTNSGTEANLMAITAAINFTRREKIVVFGGAYHGGVLTFGATPLPTTAPYDFLVLEYNDAEKALEQIQAHGEQIAAVLVEPMMGAGGCIPGDHDFLRALRAASQRIGALLIFDEVMTSRLAGHGLQSLLNIQPDLTTLGKYFGGGMSFGAFGGRADVMAQFDPRNGKLAHSGTFNNNVLSMAAGYAGLTQLFTPQAADELSARGEDLRGRLNLLCAEEGVALQFTGIGSLMNAHFTADEIRRPSHLAAVDPRLRGLLFHHLLRYGIYCAARGYIALSLPLTAADLAHFESALRAFISENRHLLACRDIDKDGGAILSDSKAAN